MSIEDFMLPCPIKKTFGIDCFGCGSQRALLLVLEGRFSEAFHLFPAIYTLILFFLLIGISYIDKKRKYTPYILSLALVNILIIIVSYFFRHPDYWQKIIGQI